MALDCRAAIFRGPGDLEIKGVSIPELKSGEVLIKVRACGLCGSDLNIFRRDPPIPKYWAGHEISGEVVETASGVKGLAPGTRVSVAPLIPCAKCDQCAAGRENICENCLFISYNLRGGFADYVVAPAENIFRLPDATGFEDAVLIEPLADVLHAFDIAGGVEGKEVVVVGCGTIGLLTVNAAKAAGAKKIVAFGKYAHQKRLAEDLGAGAGLLTGPGLSADELNALGRADIVFETVGGYESGSISQAIAMLRPGGVIILSGVHYKTPNMNLKNLTEKEIQVKGSQRYRRKDYSDAVKLFEKGAIKAARLVTHKVTLDDIMHGYAIAFDKDKNMAVKVVVCP